MAVATVLLTLVATSNVYRMPVRGQALAVTPAGTPHHLTVAQARSLRAVLTAAATSAVTGMTDHAVPGPSVVPAAAPYTATNPNTNPNPSTNQPAATDPNHLGFAASGALADGWLGAVVSATDNGDLTAGPAVGKAATIGFNTVTSYPTVSSIGPQAMAFWGPATATGNLRWGLDNSITGHLTFMVDMRQYLGATWYFGYGVDFSYEDDGWHANWANSEDMAFGAYKSVTLADPGGYFALTGTLTHDDLKTVRGWLYQVVEEIVNWNLPPDTALPAVEDDPNADPADTPNAQQPDDNQSPDTQSDAPAGESTKDADGTGDPNTMAPPGTVVADPADANSQPADANADPGATPADPNGQPATVDPAKADPANADPANTDPAAAPADNQPAQADPAAAPADNQPAQANPAAAPADNQPAQADPAAAPANDQPTQADPAAAPADNQPAQANPAAAPADNQPAATGDDSTGTDSSDGTSPSSDGGGDSSDGGASGGGDGGGGGGGDGGD